MIVYFNYLYLLLKLDMQNEMFNFSSLNYEKHFKLTLLYFINFIRNMQMLQNTNPGKNTFK